MQAGRLRDRVVILNITTSRTPSGHPEETLKEGATVWAEVKDQWAGTYIGRCGNRADNSKSLDAISARCDGRLTSESADRGIQGAILNIDGPPIPDARSSRLEILCSQRGGM